MAADLNIDVRCSVLGSVTGTDNNVPWIRRFAESWGTKYTQGSDTTAANAQIIAYNTNSIAAGNTLTLDVRALAGADGKTYLFSSVAMWLFSFDDATANDVLEVYGNGIVSTSTSVIKTSSGSPVIQIHPGGFWAANAGPTNKYLTGVGIQNFTMDNQASTPASSNVTFVVIGIGSIT